MPIPEFDQPDPVEDLTQYLPDYNPAATLQPKPTKIRRNKFCPKCGYNLRGLQLGRPCPECGRLTHRIGTATDHDLEYLGRLTWGFRFLIISWFLLLPSLPIAAIFVNNPSTLLIGLDLGYLFAILGIFLITEQDKAAKSARTKRPHRAVIARVVVLIGVIPFLSCNLVFFNLAFATLISPNWFVVALIAVVIVQTAVCVVAIRLAHEMSDDSLASRFHIFAWLIPGFSAFSLIAFAILPWIIGVAFFGPLVLLPIGFAILQIFFMVALYSLQSACAWAVRYQYHEEAKYERLRAAFKNPPTIEITKPIPEDSPEPYQQID